uniref:Reverse transcriptase domain-containing protein n=1 Tax=Tanacetum cinerariifolium TaxID=118510 RepID=A0A6L2J1E9_TANCI|nr:reverse transcriptase domain-containing protein [Tanacetum cinerariifolium]
MIQYLEKVKVLSNNFKKFSIKPVPRSENKKADTLSKISSASFAHLTKQVLVEELKEKYINEAKVLAVMEEEGDVWMTPIYNYLTEETLPVEKKNARAIRLKSGSKGHMNRILVADNALGCKKIDKSISRLPVIPAEIGMPTIRTTEVDIMQNDEALEINLDLLEEKREQTAIRKAKSKAKMEKYYNSKVCNTSFKTGDLVYRSNEASLVKENGKISPK